jgi:phenylacetate-coenzyme A ligase PaaK-like adenylate-forming protein
MQDYKSTVLVSTPSYALEFSDRMEQLGVNPKSFSLKVGLFDDEPWSENMMDQTLILTRLVPHFASALSYRPKGDISFN